ncbi:MAG: archaellin/type IV pilin N-terminal domain-containing protein [Acidilobaceae archaeon]
MRKAISPIIATVILIAVTLAIGVAIAAWIMGIWGGMGGTETLKILPNSTLTVQDNQVTLQLTIKNDGSRDARVVGVEVGVGARVCKLSNPFTTISAGAMVTGTATGTCSELTPGASYTVKVITEAGNVYQAMLVAYASPSSS